LSRILRELTQRADAGSAFFSDGTTALRSYSLTVFSAELVYIGVRPASSSQWLGGG